MKMFDADETRMIGLPYGEKNYDSLSRFHLILERYGQTDVQSVGQTGRIAIPISRVSVLTHDKNRDFRLIYGFGIDDCWSVGCGQQFRRYSRPNL